MQDIQYEILGAALNVMVMGPNNLQAVLTAAPPLAGINGEMNLSDLCARLQKALPDDPVRNLLRTALVAWDYAETPTWADGTLRNTRERRDLIYQRLAIDSDLIAQIDEDLPFAHVEQIIIVARKFIPWYTDDVRRARNFYWNAYDNYLRNVRRFDPSNIVTLDDATKQVLERLTNPEQEGVYQAKGIVVGYVQSGKTANFTGVIAKAIDAGYRLVIVLSGTMDLLRDQTQRRIDMELVGKEQIRRHVTGEPGERFDYDDDPDWEAQFISYGGRPSEMGSVDIIRLTGAGQVKGSGGGDYQSLKHGIQTLEIEKVDKRRPLYDPVNLHSAAVRLMVVKKNSARLAKLVGDLKKIGSKALSEVPSLIIDDESDQASIDTINPDKRFVESERRRRSTINQRLTDLLEILPRAQYVGYTATPFANVLVDPEDAQNIFPKDFMISLPQPLGYMGVKDFHDLDRSGNGQPKGPKDSNESAFVRGVWEPHEESTDQLLRAIDTFVLTAGIKLYRERLGVEGDFRHHTMLAHESHRQADHEALARLILSLWNDAGYDTGRGFDRLRRVYEMDILPTSLVRAPAVPVPSSIDEIRIDIGSAISRIEADHPVLVVNGTKEADTPNFDKIPIWKIVVGGAKLSRGYTIEGLTVSYFRRRALYQDTLMQMGRWFGFRPGYRDLVRLYIGRHEPLTAARKRFIDLYEAFEAICRDEDSFREQLGQYAMPEDGSEPITPLQVPPLVMNSHPQLTPAAKNKMFNARLKSMNIGGDWVERTLASDRDEDLTSNENLFAQLIADSDLMHSELSVTSAGERFWFDAFYGIIGHDSMLDVIDSYIWAEPYGTTLLKLESEFLHGTAIGDPQIDDWLLLMPQLRTNRKPWQKAGYTFSSVERARVDGFGRFKAYTGRNHRKVAEVISGKLVAEEANEEVRAMAMRRGRGVVLLYPVFQPADENPDQSETPTMGFAFIAPPNDLPRRAEFTVARPDLEDQPVVDV
jgi:hypothetical protein